MFNIKNYLHDRAENKFLSKLRPLCSYTKIVETPEMGRGVVLLESVLAGTILGVYPGELKSQKDFLEKEDFVNRSVKSAYMHHNGMIFDPTDIFGYLQDTPERRIALINEPSRSEDVNIRTVSTRRYIWYVLTKDLLEGQQLFAHYGNRYQRDYVSELSSQKIIDYGDSEIACLNLVARVYPWLKSGVDDILSY